MPELPAAFDPGFYRSAYPDLAHLDDDGLADHWTRYGRAEGRAGTAVAGREALVALVAGAESVLEIGPFCSPLLTGPNIEYLDMLDAEALRARALEVGMDASGCPEQIHHIGDLAKVDHRFAAVIGSHSIEHQPDLVCHLNEVADVLEPDGLYALIVPDKRYCFDATLHESSIADVLQAHVEKRRVHSPRSVIEHESMTTHNDARRHWAGDSADPHRHERAVRAKRALRRLKEADGGYIDVHAWQFTPDSFAEIIGLLGEMRLIRLEVAAVYDTLHDRNEFTAVLRPMAAG